MDGELLRVDTALTTLPVSPTNSFISTCPLLTPSPPTNALINPLEESNAPPTFTIGDELTSKLQQVKDCEDKEGNDSASSSSSALAEPACTQLLNHRHYHHITKDEEFSTQETNGKTQPLQLTFRNPPDNYFFMTWNWPLIRKVSLGLFLSGLVAMVALVVAMVWSLPKVCNPPVEWYQGNLLYEVFPGSFADSNGDGIGDLKGLASKVDYIESLGVRGVRLNSIFQSVEYPENYENLTSLLEIAQPLGTLQDFEKLGKSLHARNISLILDLPVWPFVKKLPAHPQKVTFLEINDTDDEDADGEDKPSAEFLIRAEPLMAHPLVDDPLVVNPLVVNPVVVNPLAEDTFVPRPENLVANPLPQNSLTVDPANLNPLPAQILVDPIAEAMEFWIRKGVDGFYLKNLDHLAEDENFRESLRRWKKVLGPKRALITNFKTYEAVPKFNKNVFLNSFNLIDVQLEVENGVEHVSKQLEKIQNSTLFTKGGNPWVHWSLGSVNSERLANRLKFRNATLGATLLQLMLPGTPSIFYGDEIGLKQIDDFHEDRKYLTHLHQLGAMAWKNQHFTRKGIVPWMHGQPTKSNFDQLDLISKMVSLRADSPSIYMNSVHKDGSTKANAEVKYSQNDLMVVQRWYPRRKSYVVVGNFGSNFAVADLSRLLYSGQVVVGPRVDSRPESVSFKDIRLGPGESVIILLD